MTHVPEISPKNYHKTGNHFRRVWHAI